MNDILVDNSRQNCYSPKTSSAADGDFTAALFSEKLEKDNFSDMYVYSEQHYTEDLFNWVGDDPGKVEAFIAHLKEKQAGYDTSRFVPIWDSYGDRADDNIRYLRAFYNPDELDGEKQLSDELVDDFMDAVEEVYRAAAGKSLKA